MFDLVDILGLFVDVLMLSLKFVLSLILRLVIVDGQSLTVQSQSVFVRCVVLDDGGSGDLVFEAHKAEALGNKDGVANGVDSVLGDHDLCVFDWSVFGEELLQVIILHGERNVLDVEVLPAKTLFQSLQSLLLLDSKLNIKRLGSTFQFDLAVELFDSLGSVVLVLVAHKAESFRVRLFVSHDGVGSQFSKLLKNLSELLLIESHGDVLDEQVVLDGFGLGFLLEWFHFVFLFL